MSLDDSEITNKSQSLPNGDDGSKSNGACFSDGGEQTEETLLSSPTVSGSSNTTDERKFFGWFGYRPKCLQNLLSAKWALFWMCWAGAVQGKSKQQNSTFYLQCEISTERDNPNWLLSSCGRNQSNYTSNKWSTMRSENFVWWHSCLFAVFFLRWRIKQNQL